MVTAEAGASHSMRARLPRTNALAPSLTQTCRTTVKISTGPGTLPTCPTWMRVLAQSRGCVIRAATPPAAAPAEALEAAPSPPSPMVPTL